MMQAQHGTADTWLRNFVKKHYRMRGLTQYKMAQAVGCSVGRIAKWLNDPVKSRPPLTTQEAWLLLRAMRIDARDAIYKTLVARFWSSHLDCYLDEADPAGTEFTQDELDALRALDSLGLFWNRSTAEIDAIVQSLLDLTREAKSRPSRAPWRIQEETEETP